MRKTTEMTDDDEVEERRAGALKSARQAVQFLENGQATGAIVLLTVDDKILMWSSHITPTAGAMADVTCVLGELSSRVRRVWYHYITDNTGDRGFLHIAPDCDDDVSDD